MPWDDCATSLELECYARDPQVLRGEEPVASILRAPGALGGIVESAADLPTVAWTLIVGAWAIVLAAVLVWARGRHRSRVGEGEMLAKDEARLPDRRSARMRDLVETLAADDEAAAGVLRWLVRETEAASAVYLELSPGGGERIVVAPRGLPHESVAGLVAEAREQLTASAPSGAGSTAVRWLGAGGSKCILLAGAIRQDEEALRFARYMLEWLRSIGGQSAPHSEGSIREIPGVAWAEERGDELLLLLAEGADRNEVASRVHRMLASSGLRTRWLEPAAPHRPPGPSDEVRAIADEPPPPAPATALGADDARVRILEVALSANGRATADVRVTWNEHELRGRGHGGPSEGGRHFASALAVADALRPLLDSDIEIRGLYTARTQGQADVMIAEVELEGQHLVGAVLVREDDPDLTGARAVLDAVNRRLTQVAGRSGRI